MNVSSALAAQTAISQNQTAEAPNKANTSDLSISSATKTFQQDRVTLSPKAFEKLKQENKQSTTDTNKSSSKQKNIQHQIAALNATLIELIGKQLNSA